MRWSQANASPAGQGQPPSCPASGFDPPQPRHWMPGIAVHTALDPHQVSGVEPTVEKSCARPDRASHAIATELTIRRSQVRALPGQRCAARPMTPRARFRLSHPDSAAPPSCDARALSRPLVANHLEVGAGTSTCALPPVRAAQGVGRRTTCLMARLRRYREPVAARACLLQVLWEPTWRALAVGQPTAGSRAIVRLRA